MKNFIYFAIIFSAGYFFNDLVTNKNFNVVKSAKAEVAGMDRDDLEDDYDFRRAVQDIIEDCEVDHDEIDC